MAGQEEGNYASSASADAGCPQITQGLTLHQKTQAADTLYFDQDCRLTDEDFDDALKQLGSLQGDFDVQKSILPQSILPQSSSAAVPLDETRLCKKRKYVEALQHWKLSVPVDQNQLSSSAITAQDKTVAISQTWEISGEENVLSLDVPKDGIHVMRKRNVETLGHQKNQKKYASPYGPATHVGKINSVPGAVRVSDSVPASNQEHLKYGLDIPFRGQHEQRLVQKQASCNRSDHNRDGKWACVTAKNIEVTEQGDSWDPDVPLPSIETGCAELGQNWDIEEDTSSRSFLSNSTLRGALYETSRPTSTSTIHFTLAKAPGLPRTRQHPHKSSQKSSQTSQIAKTATGLLNLPKHNLVTGSVKTSSQHQVPADLRLRFDALLKKFQTDDLFQKSVEAYIMEFTGGNASDGHPVQQDLSGMSRVQIIARFRALELELANLKQNLAQSSQSDTRSLEKWYCHQLDVNGDQCGKSNQAWECIWSRYELCQKCGGSRPDVDAAVSEGQPNSSAQGGAFRSPLDNGRRSIISDPVLGGGTFVEFRLDAANFTSSNPPDSEPVKRQRSRKRDRRRSQTTTGEDAPVVKRPCSLGGTAQPKAAMAKKADPKLPSSSARALTKGDVETLSSSNDTAARFLGGQRKNWEPRLASGNAPRREVIEIDSDHSTSPEHLLGAERDSLVPALEADLLAEAARVESKPPHNQAEPDLLAEAGRVKCKSPHIPAGTEVFAALEGGGSNRLTTEPEAEVLIYNETLDNDSLFGSFKGDFEDEPVAENELIDSNSHPGLDPYILAAVQHAETERTERERYEIDSHPGQMAAYDLAETQHEEMRQLQNGSHPWDLEADFLMEMQRTEMEQSNTERIEEGEIVQREEKEQETSEEE